MSHSPVSNFRQLKARIFDEVREAATAWDNVQLRAMGSGTGDDPEAEAHAIEELIDAFGWLEVGMSQLRGHELMRLRQAVSRAVARHSDKARHRGQTQLALLAFLLKLLEDTR